ncbi:MAG: YggS family pyridoxal phosphate-dependent enzyme, partial [Pseudomonadota bacterium]
MSIDINLSSIRQEISQLETEHQRDVGSVSLIAVSKKKPVADIQSAIRCGQQHFGENYLQEAIDKIRTINNPDIFWHFIGPIQSNKTTAIAEHFHWVHTIDRIKIAKRLNEARPVDLDNLNVCIQINISGEDSKSGIHPAQAEAFIKDLTKFEKLTVRGLMTLPAPAEEYAKQLAPFTAMQGLLSQLKSIAPTMDTLS